jgi:hypothetical protein
MKKLILLFCVVVFLFSCNKDNTIVKTLNENFERVEKAFIPEVLSHYENLTKETSGYLSIQSYRTLAIKNEPQSGSFKVGGIILNDDGEPENFGDMTIGNVTMNANSTYGNSYGLRETEGISLYGTNTSFQLNTLLPSVNMYVPNIINITNYDYPNNVTISDNSPIEWNLDANNKLGVIMIVSYHPEDNIALSNQYSEDIFKVILTEDDGNYVLTGSDLSLFPSAK